jgi:hypothetical protein
VEVPRRPIANLEPVVGTERFGQLTGAPVQFRDLLAGARCGT